MSIRSRGSLRTYFCIVLAFCCMISTNCHDGKEHHLQKRSPDNTLSCHCESDFVDLMCTDEPTDCKSDETRHDNSCYRFIQNDLKSRLDARVQCMQSHSHLVYIGSVEEQLFIQSFATHIRNESYSVRDNYWIGLTSTLRFTWQDGSPLQHDLIEVPEGHGCFYLYGTNLDLQVGNCEMNSRYICEIPNVKPEDCNGAGKATSCYVTSSETSVSLSQGDAQVVCSLVHGGHLVTIDFTGELTFIRGLLVGSTNENTTCWIGLKSEYIWLDGTRANFQAFTRKLSSHAQQDLCFRLTPWNHFVWNDHRCSTRSSYICERELPARKQLYTTDDVCSPPLANLNRLVKDGPLCVRNSSDVFGIPFLCKCGTDDCVEGCSCVESGSRNFTCSCGYCSFSTAPVPNRLSYDEWQVTTPPLSCTCTNQSGDGKNQTDKYQFEDGAFRGLNNLSCGTNAAASSIIVGVIIAVLVTVVIISLTVLLCLRRRSNKSSLSNVALTKTEHAHDNKANSRNQTNTQENATSIDLAQGIDDDGYADPGYEDPTAGPLQKIHNNNQITTGEPRNPSGSGLPTPPKVTPYKRKKNDSSYAYIDERSLSVESCDKGRGIFYPVKKKIASDDAGSGEGDDAPVRSAPLLEADCRTSDTTRDDVRIEEGYQTFFARKRSEDVVDPAANTYASLDPNGSESVIDNEANSGNQLTNTQENATSNDLAQQIDDGDTGYETPIARLPGRRIFHPVKKKIASDDAGSGEGDDAPVRSAHSLEADCRTSDTTKNDDRIEWCYQTSINPNGTESVIGT